MSACSDDDDDYLKELEKEYARLIVGKWFNFSPEVSAFMDYKADGSYSVAAYHREKGWIISPAGQYRLEGNQLINVVVNPDGSTKELVTSVEITEDEFICKANSVLPEDQVHYRVKESFDITGKYAYLNSVVRVVPAEGKTALQLPEGVTFNGQNSISIDAMHGDRIIDVMKKFFADATFAADGKLNHTLEGETKVKNYTLNGNNLVFNLYEGSDTYKVNATSFPDEDGDRLFIIIPKQAAWLGGMVDLVEKENAGLKLDESQIKALKTEFMNTFETFTVILSLSKK
jgi:hypothetical protein